MASVAELQDALVNADKAGDKDAATALANALFEAKGQKPETTEKEGATLKGVAAEGGKGFARGVSQIAEGAMGVATNLLLGPVVGPMAREGYKALAKPSLDLIKAKPENQPEQFAGTAGELAGASVAGGGITRPMLNVVAPSVLGAAGEQVAGEPGKLIGSLSPLAATAATGIIRRLARGPQTEAAARLATLDAGGVQPTLSDIAPSRGLIQTTTGKFPVAREITNKAITAQSKEIETKIDDLITASRQKHDVGESIQEGLGTWKNQFYETWRKLDDKVSGLMGEKSVPLESTQKALFKVTTKIDHDELNAIFGSTLLNKMQEAIAKHERLPFDTVLQLRRAIGQKASGGFAQLKSDADMGDLKMLYKALSEDIDTAASAVPGAAEAIKKANKYYQIGSERIDAYYGKLSKQANPEKVFEAIESGSQKGILEARNVMKAIPKDARDDVANLVLERMGKQGSKRQGDFDVTTFLKRWDELPDESRRAIFGGTSNPTMLSDLNKIAKAGNLTIESEKAIFKPGIGMAVGYGAPAITIFFAPLTTLSALGVATSGSYLMTNPRFVRWLAQSTTLPTGSIPSHLARLETMAKSENEDTQKAISDYAKAFLKSDRENPLKDSVPAMQGTRG